MTTEWVTATKTARGPKWLGPPFLLSSEEEGDRQGCQWPQCGRGEKRIRWRKICSSDKDSVTLLTCGKLLWFRQAPFSSPTDVPNNQYTSRKPFQTAASPVKTQQSWVQSNGQLHCLGSVSEKREVYVLLVLPNGNQIFISIKARMNIQWFLITPLTASYGRCTHAAKNQIPPIQRVVYLSVFLVPNAKFQFDVFYVTTSFLRRGEQDTETSHRR